MKRRRAIKMRAGYKAAVSITILLLLSSFILIPTEELSADEYSIDLLNEDGSIVDPDAPLISKLLTFTTYTDEHGTRYFLEEETVLTEKTFYLRINAPSGTFHHVMASVPSAAITGSLHKAGLEITLVNGEDDFAAVLDTGDGFEKVFSDGSGDAAFRPNVLYKLTIMTAHGIEGDSQVEKTPKFTLRFDANPINSYTVVFMNDGKEYARKPVEKNTTLKDFPDDPVKPGYTFNGWFDEKMDEFTEETVVTRNMEVHSEWSRATTCTVTFYNMGLEYAKRTVEVGSTLKDFPDDPERTDWTFDGWFDDNENKFTDRTRVESDMNVHSKWSQEPPVPPGPTPPTPPHDKETKEEEVIVEPDGTVITLISDLIEHPDGTYDL